MRTRTRRVSLTVLLSIFLCCLIGLLAVDRAFAAASSSEEVYVELYSPLNGKTPVTSDADYLTANVEDTDLTESGKGLKLSYTAGANYAVTATIPFTVEKNDGFEGYALWLDVPATADAYTFSLYVQQGDAWHDMSAGNPLCLVGTDKSYEIKMSGWKRLQLNGFRGWLLMPKTCYRDPLPVRTTNMIVQFEAETDAKRSSDIDITVGTVGYYTNLKAFLYEYADPEAVDNDIRAQIDGYILKANALKPETDYQKKLRGKMLVYYSNLKEHFDELTTDEKTEVEGGLYATYCEYMEEYRFAEIKQTRFIMSFGIISDTHITNYNNTSYLEGAMRDMLKLDPDLAAMFHLGDMSDSGVSSQGEANTDLDNYYDYIAAHKPTNSRGEEIPVINVMGNHDVRGPQSEGYPSASYPLAVEMYLAREGGRFPLLRQVDKRISLHHA